MIRAVYDHSGIYDHIPLRSMFDNVFVLLPLLSKSKRALDNVYFAKEINAAL